MDQDAEFPKLDTNALDTKQAILAAIIASTDDTIISKTTQGIITSWNPAAERMFGYTETEAIGQHISLIIPHDRLAEEAFIIGQILKGEKIDHFETLRSTKNGDLIPISLTVSPIRNSAGQIIGASKIARDISERQIADEKQAMLAAIISTSDDAIISKTMEGIITSWNPAAELMFGHSAQEAIGKHISLIIPPGHLGEEDNIISNISKGNKIDHFETIRIAKDGRLIPISVSVSPIRSSSGKIIGASKIARDISEQKKAAEKQGVLAAIVDTSDDTILSKTLDGIITSWNKAAVRMFGYTEAEAIGQHISLIIPPDRLNEETYIIGEVSKGNSVDHFQTFRRAKNGSLVPISLSVSPVTDSNGTVIGASKIARDISAEQASQQETAKLYEQLKELNAKKDEFIGLASHELKTPLTSINGYLQILGQRVVDEKDKMFVSRTQQQVNKLSSLVNDLLDVSKIEAGKLHFDEEEFDIRGIVDDSIDLITHSNNNYRITLHSPVTKCIIKGDSHRIQQVLVNLLTNAIRYSPGSKEIEVYLSYNEQEVKIGIKDYGIGIAPEKLNNIFSRYYRVDDINSKASGLGIGLYLSSEIVTRHQGKIWAESEPKVGSTFWFTLPVNNGVL
ncbi:MAG: PAS domain-containing sensor histidine kinase [Mucilaginibacter sp.]|uniref:PAS domain-containing sensor histidine kinase n=1 Tax=Mucilaginibacter sp. TaxID=1882438 RepID=UPI003267DCEA